MIYEVSGTFIYQFKVNNNTDRVIIRRVCDSLLLCFVLFCALYSIDKHAWLTLIIMADGGDTNNNDGNIVSKETKGESRNIGDGATSMVAGVIGDRKGSDSSVGSAGGAGDVGDCSDELKKLMRFTDEELIAYFKTQDASYRPPHPLPRQGYWDENAQPFGIIPTHCDPRTRPYWLWTLYSEQ